MKELQVQATLENYEQVSAFVEAELEQLDCPLPVQLQVGMAVEELYGNIANYAYNPEVGPATIQVEVTENPLCVIITFLDQGKPYDPLKHEDPDITLSLDEREVGGLGIFMVKKTMDDVKYEYVDGTNILTIRKTW